MNRMLLVAFSLIFDPLFAGVRGGVDRESDLFPSIDGWDVKEERTVYTRDNLWELIDGAADLFVSYGFEDLRAAEYQSKDSRDVRVELYRHSSRDMAFGMYAAERSPEFAFVPLGTQGYIEEGLLNFLAGTYYVKISSHVAGKRGREAMLLVAGALEKRLKQDKKWPPVLSLTPVEGRVPNTEGMVASNFLGYSFFTSAFTCRYDSSRGAQVFIMNCGTGKEAGNILKKYSRLSKGDRGEDFEGVALFSDPNHGRVALVRRGKFLGGVLSPSGGTAPNKLTAQLDSLLAGAAAEK